MKKNVPAFSLIEMSIVLIIMGIVAGATLPLVNSMLLSHRRQVTVEKQERILKAFGAFYAENGWLPAPAQLNTDGKASTDEAPSQFGIVPYKTLGIPKSDVKDAYHHWITYGVHSERMGEKKEERNFALLDNHKEISRAIEEEKEEPEETLNEEIFIKDGEKKNLIQTEIKNPVLIVLISHGPQGTGAFEGPPAKENTDEYINSVDARGQAPVDIIDRPLSLAKENPFLHRVRWETDRNFRQNYAHTQIKPLSSSLNKIDRNVTENTTNNAPLAEGDNAHQENFASPTHLNSDWDKEEND